MIFRFIAPFPARLVSKFAKSANMTPKIFFFKKIFMGIKNAEFDADFRFVKKTAKKFTDNKLLPKTRSKNGVFNLYLINPKVFGI